MCFNGGLVEGVNVNISNDPFSFVLNWKFVICISNCKQFFFALNFFSCEMEYGVNQIEIGKSNLLTKRVECVHITTAVKSDRALLFYDFSCLGIELRYFYAVEKRYKMKSGTNCYFTECFVL